MATFQQRFQRRGWPRRLAIGSVVSLALFALAGFFVAPPVARHLAERQLGELLGRNVAIARVRMNPFALSLTVEGFQIFEADRTTPFVGFRRLYVNAQLSSLYQRAPVIKEMSLDGLRIRVVRLKATPDGWADIGAYNFSDILAHLAARTPAPSPPPDPDASAPRFSLNNIRLSDGAVTFEDRPLGSRHQITDLGVGVPFVSTLPVYLDSFVEPGLSVRVDGTPFAVVGRTKPFKDSRETLLELRLDALDLTKYVAFVPLPLPFLVESARLTLALDLSFVRPRVDAPTLRLKGRVVLDGLDLREKRAAGPIPLARLDKLEISIADSDVTAKRFQLSKILLSGLDLRIRRLHDGTINLEHMVPATPGQASGARPVQHPAPPPASPLPGKAKGNGDPQFSVGTFTLEKATVRFRDESVTPVFESDVRDMAVSMRGLSNAPGASAQVKVALRAVPGGVLTQEGTLRLTPLSASGTIAIEGIELARLAPYTHDLVAFDIVKGRLRLGTRYLFEQAGDPPTVRLSDALVELSDLALRRREAREDFFRVGEFAVRGAKLDLRQRTVIVEAISTRDGRVKAGRDREGVVDLSRLLSAPPAAAAAPAVPVPRAEPLVATTPGPAWTVSLARLDIERWGARFEDHAVSPTAVLTVDPLTLHATTLSTVPGTRTGVELRLGINKTGRLTLTGTAGVDPVAANLRFDLRAFEILPFQPYFRDQVGLTITSGTVSAEGKLGLNMKTSKGAKPDPQVDLNADIEVAAVATVDRDKQEPLVKWGSLRLGGLRMSNHPMTLAINEVALSDLDARLVMFPDGRFNLQESLAAPGAAPQTDTAARASKNDHHQKVTPPAETPSNGPPPQVSIAKVTIQRGSVMYTDRVIQPRYTAEVTDLGGRIAGLSSTAGSIADVDLHAAVNRSGTLMITGKTNPLAKDLFVDVQVAVKDIELPPASPYAGKFAGYGISKGKLDLSLDYKVANRKLDAKNSLVLDQFTFGDKVDSPDAVKAPVRLAVALLKDRRGVIDIDLPISGSLDDPKFKVWPAILKVLGNLLVKAATAPFSLIAAAFGGGDELSRMDFASGGFDLDANAQRKVRGLAKALLERPGLSLEIEGIADPKPDREGLRRFVFERKLKAQKLTELVQAGAAVSSPDQVQLDAVERPRLLKKAYQAEKFSQSSGAVDPGKTLTEDEMEKLILTNTRVEDDDLRALALRRATVVQASLVKHAPGATARLFLITPRVAPGGGHVELKLKKD
jgi:uncharacterized protein involved in outer membrane biogenesis